MIKTSIEKLAYEIGFDIGNSSDIDQANLLNGLCAGLRQSILREHDLEKQLCYLTDKLNLNSHQLIQDMVKFIEIKDKHIDRENHA